MTFVDGSRGYKVFKFEDSANAVTTETQEDAESLAGSVAPTSEFDIQTEGISRAARGFCLFADGVKFSYHHF